MFVKFVMPARFVMIYEISEVCDVFYAKIDLHTFHLLICLNSVYCFIKVLVCSFRLFNLAWCPISLD